MSEHDTEETRRFLAQIMLNNGYQVAKSISNGRYACISSGIFNTTIRTGHIGDETGWDEEWTYPDYKAAAFALHAWDGAGEPTGWTRHVPSNRRISQSPDEVDQDGNTVGAVGVTYVRP